MCEIFGAYGWSCGVRLEKYLVDHFLVRGVNRFVPHAFSPKAFPDPDCPPHFYAHGHHPQYRHFGALMAYTNRICHLLDGGRRIVPVAVLYHGDSAWAGNAMLTQKPCRVLADAQIDYDIIPQDVFTERMRYKTVIGKMLAVNTQKYHALVVPELEYVTGAFAAAIKELTGSGFPVIFINSYPKGLCDGSTTPGAFAQCPVLPLDGLVPFLCDRFIPELNIMPQNNRVRYLHYIHQDGTAFYCFVNEGTLPYRGTISMAESRPCAAYNAWDNRLEETKTQYKGGRAITDIVIEPFKSMILVFDDDLGKGKTKVSIYRRSFREDGMCRIGLNDQWERSICEGREYPHFGEPKKIDLPDRLAEEKPDFSGFVRYERRIKIENKRNVVLEITDAHEGVELFVNGKSAGIQIVPPYRYDISGLAINGENEIAVEVATTLGVCGALPENCINLQFIANLYPANSQKRCVNRNFCINIQKFTKVPQAPSIGLTPVGVSFSYETKTFDSGAFIFVDAVYAELSAAYLAEIGKVTGEMEMGAPMSTKQPIDEDYVSHVIIVDLLGKYPIALNEKLTVFPALGVGLKFPFGGNDFSDKEHDVTWGVVAKAGAGLDISLTQRLFLRCEALFAYQFASDKEAKIEIPMNNKHKFKFKFKDVGYNLGPQVKIAVGYKIL
jgi:hypothetical protein